MAQKMAQDPECLLNRLPGCRVVGEHAAVRVSSQVDALRVETVVVPDVVDHRPDKGDVIVAGGPVAGVDHVAAPAGLVAVGGV